jgi:hypothetical protein
MLARGHWPHACPPELRAHVTACKSCAEFLLVTQAFQQSRATASAEVRLPAAGAIWWRAQLRRRNAAVERMGRPMLGAYVFALAITLVVAVVFTVTQAHHGLRWLDWFAQTGSAAAHADASSSTLLSMSGSFPILIAVFATLALVGAVVVYLTAEKQ